MMMMMMMMMMRMMMMMMMMMITIKASPKKLEAGLRTGSAGSPLTLKP